MIWIYPYEGKRRVNYSGLGIYYRTDENIKTSKFFSYSKQIMLQTNFKMYPAVRRNLFRLFGKACLFLYLYLYVNIYLDLDYLHVDIFLLKNIFGENRPEAMDFLVSSYPFITFLWRRFSRPSLPFHSSPNPTPLHPIWYKVSVMIYARMHIQLLLWWTRKAMVSWPHINIYKLYGGTDRSKKYIKKVMILQIWRVLFNARKHLLYMVAEVVYNLFKGGEIWESLVLNGRMLVEVNRK